MRPNSDQTRSAREEIAGGLAKAASQLGAPYLGIREPNRRRDGSGSLDSVMVGAIDRSLNNAVKTRLTDPSLGDYATLVHPSDIDPLGVMDLEAIRRVIPWVAWLFGAGFEDVAELCARFGHHSALLFNLNAILGADASICWTYEDEPESQQFRHFASWGLDDQESYNIPRGEGLVGKTVETDGPVLEHFGDPRVKVYHEAAVEKYGWYQMERHSLVGPDGLVGALAIYYGPERHGPKGRGQVEQRNATLLAKSILTGAVEREWYETTRQRWEEKVLEGANRLGVGLSVLGLAHDLATRADRLQVAANALTQFLGPMTPDNRAQIARQLSRLSFRSTASPESIVNTLETLDGEAKYLKEVIGQLNRLSSSRSEKVVKQDLAEAVSELRPLVRALVGRRAHLVESLASGSAVRLNTTSLARIVLNLVTNAMDWNARNITIRVGPAAREKVLRRRGSRDLDGLVCLVVEDDGSGMSPAALEHCFDAFATERPNGTGLGLFVVDKLVRGFGGHMEVDSKLGEGTTMIALFPKTTIGGDA